MVLRMASQKRWSPRIVLFSWLLWLCVVFVEWGWAVRPGQPAVNGLAGWKRLCNDGTEPSLGASVLARMAYLAVFSLKLESFITG